MKTPQIITDPKNKKKIVVSHLIFLIVILIVFVFIEIQITKINNTNSSLKNFITTQGDTLKNIQTNITQYLNAANALTLSTLKEAQYLINQADLQLKLYQNKSIAINLLTTAEKNISTIPNFDASTINQAIANDITAINNFNYVDETALLEKISSLATQIDSLSLVNTKLDTQPQNLKTPDTTPEPQKTWGKFWQNTLEKLQSIIIIRKHDAPLQPILSQTQQLFTRQHIELTLQQASWAVLHHQNSVYQYSLKKANDLLIAYFAYNLDAVKELTAQIKALQTINITTQSPTLSSLRAINTKIDQEQVIDETKS
jgi:uroporphyrin-3 C-methyltransferase